MHIPVLLKEILYFLNVKPGGRYVDATVGSGGHAEAILKAGGEVLGIDQDLRALEITRKRLISSGFSQAKACPASNSKRVGGIFRLIHGNFSQISKLVRQAGWRSVDGVLFDLGFASFQVEDTSYGLSFKKAGNLDMRMDKNLQVTAADLVNMLSGKELTRLFRNLAQERLAKSIAEAIVQRRRIKPFNTTDDLAETVAQVYREHHLRSPKLHPATKVFLALRMAVNTEIDNLEKGLPSSYAILKKRGRLAVISFHSTEDRVVKNFFKKMQQQGKMLVLTKRPVVPSQHEIEENPRARSAKLRVGEKI